MDPLALGILYSRFSDSPMTDIMVDVETTGTDPSHGAILQIAAIKFNYETGEVGQTFNRSLAIAPGRYWDADTQQWWMKQKRSVFDAIVAKAEDPRAVIEAFYLYALDGAPKREGSHPGGLRFWSKPVSFDFPFIASYMRQYGLQMPFHFRVARDLNTHIAALRGCVHHYELEHITLPGDAHNALYDCALQLKKLFAAKSGDWGEVLAA